MSIIKHVSDLEPLIEKTTLDFDRILVNRMDPHLVESKQLGILNNVIYVSSMLSAIETNLNIAQVENVCKQIQTITSHLSFLCDGKNTQKHMEHISKIQQLTDSLKDYCQKNNIIYDENKEIEVINNMTKEDAEEFSNFLEKTFPEACSSHTPNYIKSY